MINVRTNQVLDRSSANFSMKFANGYTISLALGDGMYSTGNAKDGYSTAEVGAWDADGEWVKLGENDTVIGYQSAEEVLALMNKIAAMEAPKND